MCNAKILRDAENSEKWVVEKKRNEHQANCRAFSAAAGLDS
jgi:hypothetical protein